MRPRVVLLREAAEPEPDPYVAALGRAGFDARCVPVLRFEPTGRGTLPALLNVADRFVGLVLTSPRAAAALAEYELEAWRGKPIYVTGARTAEQVGALGLRPAGETSGSATALADHIVETGLDGPLLFLCGDRRRDDLPDRLRAAGLGVEEHVVYRTIGDPSHLERALERGLEWVAFFSPSGVEAALECDGISWNSLRRAAIGPTTAEALGDAGLLPHAVAAIPSPESLAAALFRAHRSADV